MPNTVTPISHPHQDFSIGVVQDSLGGFRVTYGAQSKGFLTWQEASKELGACLFHSLECAGLIERRDLAEIGD